MDQYLEIKKMLHELPYADLQAILNLFGYDWVWRKGKKEKLQETCIALLASDRTAEVSAKIRELHQRHIMEKMTPSLASGLVVPIIPVPAASGRESTATKEEPARQQTSSESTSSLNPSPGTSEPAPASGTPGAVKIVVKNEEPAAPSAPAPPSPSGSSPEILFLEQKPPASSTPLTVTMERLPAFFETEAVILEPTVIRNFGGRGKMTGIFHLDFTPAQAMSILRNSTRKIEDKTEDKGFRNHYGLQTRLRFCIVRPHANEQKDFLPVRFLVGVDGNIVELPAFVDPVTKHFRSHKRPSVSVDITGEVIRRLAGGSCRSALYLQWMPEKDVGSYAVSVILVKAFTAEDLLQIVYGRDKRPTDLTVGLLNEITTANYYATTNCDGIITQSQYFIRISTLCPIGRTRMRFPCRAISCEHVQCFDLEQFLRMNERLPSFLCPICRKKLDFEELWIDELISNIVDASDPEDGAGSYYDLYSDGHWEPAAVGATRGAVGVVPGAKRRKPNGEERSGVAATTTSTPTTTTASKSGDLAVAASAIHQATVLTKRSG